MIIWAIVVTVLLLTVLFAVLFRGMVARPITADYALCCIQAFSLEAYAPMKRLLAEQDFEYLARLPGYEPSIERALRRERKAIYLAYLNRLVKDYQCLFTIAKTMVVYGTGDGSELAACLWRQQINFYAAVALIRIRLALYPAVAGTWDLQPVFQPLRVLQTGIQRQAFQS